MATPSPILTPEQRIALESQQKYTRMLRNVAIGGAIACPILIIMPPRKLDLYTFSLGVGFYLSADHLSSHFTGRDLVQHMTPKFISDPLPTEKAREMQRKLAEERERGRKLNPVPEQNAGVLQRLWMGDEKEGWKEKRLEEERKALEEGKGYGDIMMEQIWEVWNWDKKKGKDGEKKE